MIVTIERVSKFGVMVAGDWKNLSKFDPVNLSGIKAGDTVDLELKKDKYITTITKLGTDSSYPPSEPDQKDTGLKSEPSSSSYNNSSRDVSTRQTAVNAVLGSLVVANLVKDLDNASAMRLVKELTKEFASYALTGSFSPVPSEELTSDVGHS